MARITSAREFARLEYVADRVRLASSEEGRKELQRDASARRAVAMEAHPLVDRIIDYAG